MATTTSITTTYAGESAGEYISAALLSGSTIENGGITVKPNVKFKEVIKKLGTDGIVKDASCDFTATSTLTLTERILQPELQQVNLHIRKVKFLSKNSILTKLQHFHEFFTQIFFDNFSREIKVVNS